MTALAWDSLGMQERRFEPMMILGEDPVEEMDNEIIYRRLLIDKIEQYCSLKKESEKHFKVFRKSNTLI